MGGENRVPEKDAEFDPYLRDTTAVLQDGTPNGAERLGLTPAQAAAWIAFFDAWIILYPKYTNLATRTKAITSEKNLLKKDFTIFAVNPLKLIDASGNITASDRQTFRLPLRDGSPTARGVIGEVPFGSLKGKSGGMVEARVRRESDATRASMHELSDAIEFRYKVIDAEEEGPALAAAPPTSASMPTPEQMPHTIMSKKAMWRMNMGTNALGKRVIGFFRWVNLSKPENNSGWSELATTIIS